MGPGLTQKNNNWKIVPKQSYTSRPTDILGSIPCVFCFYKSLLGYELYPFFGGFWEFFLTAKA